MRLIIDRERCVGAGLCVLSAPELFDQSDADGRVVVRASTDADDPAVHEAGRLCPSGALRIAGP
ncbi:ferredoxin [Phytohabitans rumicis]|uniref:Ferredoxin n=2 Tax=Phytohabitans rumicis TaxID=1076125 RepID=A0A6V8KXS7_9ACTN|nr:ferredoxin [Phytohabitans rumicis]GFJ87129.1 ferredoxin [Phytohabitans rumicis]